jgi:branched-chain amino acid transport system substrate-binding protein
LAAVVTVAVLASSAALVGDASFASSGEPAKPVSPASALAAPSTKDGTLVVASLAPETGELSAIIDSLRRPVQIAVEEINAAGGVNGKPVTFVTGDDGSGDVDIAAKTLDTLVKTNKADVVIGPASSNVAIGILDNIKDNGVLTCSGSNTLTQLTKDGPAGSGGLYFRTSPPDTLQAKALAELILSDGKSKIGILARDDRYGAEFAAPLSKALKEGGAKVVADVAYSTDEGATYDADVKKVAAKKPDAIAVLGFNDDGAKVVQSMIAQGVGPGTSTGAYTADVMNRRTFAQTVDPVNPGVVAGMKGTEPAPAPANIPSGFADTFAATGIDPIFSAHYYDCTILAALAAVKAKSDDPKAIAKAFTQNLRGKETCNTFAACKTLLESGKTIHWSGASSAFDKFGKNEPKGGRLRHLVVRRRRDHVVAGPASQIKIG